VSPSRSARSAHGLESRSRKIDGTTLVEVQLHTGRTHQIRVHFSAVKHPVVGDTLYGAAEELRVGKVTLPAIERNFLHAAKAGFAQPRTGAWIEVRAALPSELREYLKEQCVKRRENRRAELTLHWRDTYNRCKCDEQLLRFFWRWRFCSFH